MSEVSTDVSPASPPQDYGPDPDATPVTPPTEYDPASKPGATPDTHVTTIETTRMFKEGSVVVNEEQDEEIIQLRVPPPGVPMAEVGASSSMTINMGNFESVKLEVQIRLPTPIEELDEAYKTAKKFVDLHLNKEVTAVKNYRASKAGGEPHGT